MSEPSKWAKEIMRDMQANDCSCDDPLLGASAANCDKCMARLLDAARAEEREACAKIADEHGHDIRPLSRDPSHSATMQGVFGAMADCAWFIAATIRARGDA